jgi:hypothetical protein
MQPEEQPRSEAADAPNGVRAIFKRDITEPDRDGARLHLVVSDGRDVWPVYVVVAGSPGGQAGMDFDPTLLERIVERRIADHLADHDPEDWVAKPLYLNWDDAVAVVGSGRL